MVEQQLLAGHYHSPEEVVARALETLAEKEPLRSAEDERRAVQDMLEFTDQHRSEKACAFAT